jgi:outer membrane lipoprotein
MVLSLFILGTACTTTTISTEMRQRARTGLAFGEVLKNPAAYIGSTVIWGGLIIDTINFPEGTVLTVLEAPLDYREMPRARETSRGRFIANVAGFLDPEIYQKGRRITLAGDIIGSETKPLGETKYTYPVVQIRELHLWRERIVWTYPYPYYWYGWPYYWPRHGLYFGHYYYW